MTQRKQLIPDIEFGNFPFGLVKKLFDEKKICINNEYQRADVWKQVQKIELIESIHNSYSMGVLVLYINEKGQYEILDGQQRLLTIYKYLSNKIDLSKSDLPYYSDLDESSKIFLDAYSVYYLKLKSHNPETKEEDIVQTFLRLQEGTPLNKAEKINAYRGAFKDAFRSIVDTHQIFNLFGKDERFRLRLLCAELLLLELETDFENLIFPDLTIAQFKTTLKKYEKNISETKLKFFKGNLDYLLISLNLLLTAITPRDLVPAYLLVSYLRRKKADNSNLKDELSVFIEDLLQDLNKFSVYDTKAPKGMDKVKFKKYLQYKIEGRQATTSASIKFRFDFFHSEFKLNKPYIEKDSKRLHDKEQKRTLYLRQKGICPECKKKIDFRIDGSAHHVIAHSNGGKTDDLNFALLLHIKCHERIEKRIHKHGNKSQLNLL